MSHTEIETNERIESIEIVSGHPRVAIRLIELSKHIDAELEDYSTLIETDAGLASRMLALVNSAWFAPSSPIQTVKRSVCTLGLGQVRVIALSHCVASLHKSMNLNGEDARSMWAGSMCKAIAARLICEEKNPDHAPEAFTIALLQDLGLAMFCAMDAQAVGEIRRNVELSSEDAAAEEIEHFGMTHSEAGSKLARRLSLPELYASSIGTHHNMTAEVTTSQLGPVELASHVASLLPHDIRYWTKSDMDQLRTLIETDCKSWSTLEDFMQAIQAEFAETDKNLNSEGAAPDLMECLSYASEENARAASVLVAQNSSLMSGADRLHEAVALAERATKHAETRADKDPLTKLFNRNGWDRRAKLTIRQARSTGNSVGMAFFDLDYFKDINDTHGHQAGDAFLKEVGERIKESVRVEDLVCRWGGDEFVILFRGIDEEDCTDAAKRVKEHVESAPVHYEGEQLTVSVTCGFVVMDPSKVEMDLSALMEMADENLYQAKETERGSFVMATAA